MIMNMSIRRVVSILVVLLSLAGHPASSLDRNPGAKLVFAGYLDKKSTRPVYRLELENPDKVRVSVTIRDSEGEVLYREWLEGDVRVRNYCFDREETGRTDLVFELSRDGYDPVFSRIRLDRRSRN
jgi:hypothetical protein